MPDSIDHILVASPDPDGALQAIETQLGLRSTGSGRHPALGTFNHLIWLGDSFVELIGIEDRDLAGATWVGQPVVQAVNAGGGLATWAAATHRIRVEVPELRVHGSDLSEPIPGERVRPDGRIVRWALAAPSVLGPLEPPFLIEHDLAAAEWSPEEQAERAAQRHPIGGPVRLEMLELPAADLPKVTARYLRTTGIGPFRPSLAGRGARDATVGPHTIRLVPSRDQGWPRATIHLRVADPASATGTLLRDVELLGCRWLIRAS